MRVTKPKYFLHQDASFAQRITNIKKNMANTDKFQSYSPSALHHKSSATSIEEN